MMDDQDRFEKFATQAEMISHGERKWIDVESLGNLLDLAPEESRQVADQLANGRMGYDVRRRNSPQAKAKQPLVSRESRNSASRCGG